MAAPAKAFAHESLVIGKTEEDQQRNAVLLSGYDYARYEEALTGFTGQDLQRVGSVKWMPAVRTRVGSRGNCKAGFARLPDGDLVVAPFRANMDSLAETKRFEMSIYRSTDLGLSWKKLEHTPLIGKEPSLAALPDGTLVLSAQYGLIGPSAKRDQQPVYRSRDGGRTWQTFFYQSTDYPRNLFVEKDGSLLMVVSVKNDWYGTGTGSPNLLVCRSQDAGATWSQSEGVVAWDWAGFGENAVIRLKDDRLVAAFRRQIPGTRGEGFEDSVVTESVDDGKTWSTPRILVPTASVHAYLTQLQDDRVLCTYSNYHVPWGVSAVLSSDGGKSWDLENTIRLSVSNGYWVGWPVTLQLPDKSLITSYATTAYFDTKAQGVTCEVVRWRLPR